MSGRLTDILDGKGHEVFRIDADASVLEAVQKMVEANFGSLLVMDHGKPTGIVLFARAARLAGARLPAGLLLADLMLVGITAATGFTVSLFFATAAFPAGAALAETKMGALLSFSAAPLALIASRLSRRRAAAALVTVAGR